MLQESRAVSVARSSTVRTRDFSRTNRILGISASIRDPNMILLSLHSAYELSALPVIFRVPAMALVRPNVGGQLFTTTESTLLCYPNSLFASLLDRSAGIPTVKDERRPLYRQGPCPICGDTFLASK